MVEQSLADMNLEVYGYMWGASEFTVTGTLLDFDATRDLPSLDLPTLFVCGRYDEAQPETVRQQADLVPGARFEVIEDASHMTMLEQPEAFWGVVGGFLAEQPARSRTGA